MSLFVEGRKGDLIPIVGDGVYTHGFRPAALFLQAQRLVDLLPVQVVVDAQEQEVAAVFPQQPVNVVGGQLAQTVVILHGILDNVHPHGQSKILIGVGLAAAAFDLRGCIAAVDQQGVTIGGLTIPAPPTDAQISGGGKVDAAYIVATPQEIAFIKPMIAMRNGSQSGATLYASSRSAQGTAGPDFRLEMDGLQYSEIPMLAGSNPSLMQQALSAVRNDYSLARLYAMGVDAWALANHFTQMRQVPGFELNGNTGDLTATQDCVINRKLSWLKYQQGQIVPAS